MAATQVSVSVTAHEAKVLFAVDDDGAGVPEDDRTRIFERFTRSDGGRGRSHGGAGLGLALVQRVADAHNGTVRCTASHLGGARFEVELPSPLPPVPSQP